jgi:hypothetical protein
LSWTRKYTNFVSFEGKIPVLYVHVVKALYGMLQSALLFYKKLVKDLAQIGFETNPYDPCIANRQVNGKQHTVTWHVDDLKSSHVDPQVNDDFLKWLEKTYGDSNIGKVKATRGKRHNYLGMTFDYSTPGQVKVEMIDYVKAMVKAFPEVTKKKMNTTPWSESLFKVNNKSNLLSPELHEKFHHIVAKGLFVTKRARQDIQPCIAYLCTRVQHPTEADWQKLRRMIQFLKGTETDVLTLKADDSHVIKWHVDAAFAVHDDFKSHTGATMTLGKGAITTASTKQKVNSRSSTEAELIGLDDYIAKIMWTRHFLDSQGYDVTDNIIYQDNKSTIQLAENGSRSIGKRSRHLNIKYFFVTDLINRIQFTVKYCPTDEMTADYMTKPLTGSKLKKYRSMIMNLPPDSHRMAQECVGGGNISPAIFKVHSTGHASNNQTVGKLRNGRAK